MEVLERGTAAYTPRYQRFLVQDKRFQRQYAQIYARRLDHMRPIVRAAAAALWGVPGAVWCVFASTAVLVARRGQHLYC
jgi:hypothetical protein